MDRKRNKSQDFSDDEGAENPPQRQPMLAKQDPAGKAARGKAAASDGKIYFSYADIHLAITSLAAKVLAFKPDVIIAIGGGGFIPARMLRTVVKLPILAVSLELYDDATCTARKEVKKIQWFDEQSEVGSKVRGRRVLVVDEVDDSRTTLQYCVEELIRTNAPAAIATCVVHNKIKEKKGFLPEGVVYMAGADVPDKWNCYPWDADAYGRNIEAHEALARVCSGADKQAQTKIPAFAAGIIVGAAAAFLALKSRARA